MTKIEVAGCGVVVTMIKNGPKLTEVTVEVTAPTREYDVVYLVDNTSLEVVGTIPHVLHREMKEVHAEWREQGLMVKRYQPLTTWQKLRGWRPEQSFRRYFTKRWWS